MNTDGFQFDTVCWLLYRYNLPTFVYDVVPIAVRAIHGIAYPWGEERQGIALNQGNVAERKGTKFEVRRKHNGSGKWGSRNGTKFGIQPKRGGMAPLGVAVVSFRSVSNLGG